MNYPLNLADNTLSARVKPFQKEKLTSEELIKILNECNWNKAEAGRRISLSRTAIWKYMKKWDIPLKPV